MRKKQRKFARNARNQCGIGEILLPSASAASGLRWFRGFVFGHAGGVGNFPERKMDDGEY